MATKKKAVKKAVKKSANFNKDAKPNKAPAKKQYGTPQVTVTNILLTMITHANGTIMPGKTGKVTPYEAELLTRKKHVK